MLRYSNTGSKSLNVLSPAISEHARLVVSRIGHDFADESLLLRALTHRSAGSGNNERLEFLGDAVIELVVTAWLFGLFPRYTEGELTRLRAKIVRRESLADYARNIALGNAMHLGSGEMKSGGRHRDSLLADGFEAVIGAVFLDAGFLACRECLIALIEPGLPALVEAATTKDAKTRLQEWLQGRGLPLPSYEVVRTDGVDHRQTFTVQCEVSELQAPVAGGGSSRRRAEQEAAKRTLIELGADHADG